MSRAGTPASSAQVDESQAELDENADRSHPQVIPRIVKDKLPVIKPMANLDHFDRAQTCHASFAGLLEPLWQHMEEIDNVMIPFSRNPEFQSRTGKAKVINKLVFNSFVRDLRAMCSCLPRFPTSAPPDFI